MLPFSKLKQVIIAVLFDIAYFIALNQERINYPAKIMEFRQGSFVHVCSDHHRTDGIQYLFLSFSAK